MFGTVSNLMLYTFDLMVMLQGIGHSALCLKLINQLTAIGAEALTSQLTRVYFFFAVYLVSGCGKRDFSVEV
ncbi:hypothetical protein D3C75_1186570 [compost metagenome]